MLQPETGSLFPHLAGLDMGKRAALLLAVEPRLGGLLVCGPVGAGKSALLDAAVEVAGWRPVAVAPGMDLPPPDRSMPPGSCLVAHHFDLLEAVPRARCAATSPVLAAAPDRQPPAAGRFALVVHLPGALPAAGRLRVLEKAGA
ncbi:MAG: hypothetical protein ACYDAG_16780, partial [Chloroflexota bacterium]